MNMCLPWPTLPGTGASKQVFIGPVPEEGCRFAGLLAANCGHPIGTSCLHVSLADLEVSHLYWRAMGIKVTAMPMPKVLKDHFCILDGGLLLVVG